ncbi:hypothetical protein DFJ73DRAFT_774738 [Zopfochytrium polystomum]|nr:hypothetical protein DFJ73DRAFT_774738 [Zopfochytrium polystomum]
MSTFMHLGIHINFETAVDELFKPVHFYLEAIDTDVVFLPWEGKFVRPGVGIVTQGSPSELRLYPYFCMVYPNLPAVPQLNGPSRSPRVWNDSQCLLRVVACEFCLILQLSSTHNLVQPELQLPALPLPVLMLPVLKLLKLLPIDLLNVLPSFARRLNKLQLPMRLASVTLLAPLAAPDLLPEKLRLLGLKNTTDVLPHFVEHMLKASTFPTAKGSQFFMRIRGSLSSFTWTTFKAMYNQHFGLDSETTIDSAFRDYTWSPSATSPAAALTNLELLNSHQSEPHSQRGIKKHWSV